MSFFDWMQRGFNRVQRLISWERRQSADELRALVATASVGEYFYCDLNGCRCWLPQETIWTMRHCLHSSPASCMTLLVELDHIRWLLDHVPRGGVVLDIGAATGAMALPASRLHGGSVSVIAFEPARVNRQLLQATLERNEFLNVEVVPVALSDTPGEAEFAEYRHSRDHATPFLPETSALSIDNAQIDWKQADRIAVEVETLDRLMASRSAWTTIHAAKIDVEGFESHVLQGAAKFLEKFRPALSIDIHRNPAGDGTTEKAVRAHLEPWGYTFANRGHVLLCSPPRPAP